MHTPAHEHTKYINTIFSKRTIPVCQILRRRQWLKVKGLATQTKPGKPHSMTSTVAHGSRQPQAHQDSRKRTDTPPRREECTGFGSHSFKLSPVFVAHLKLGAPRRGRQGVRSVTAAYTVLTSQKRTVCSDCCKRPRSDTNEWPRSDQG